MLSEFLRFSLPLFLYWATDKMHQDNRRFVAFLGKSWMSFGVIWSRWSSIASLLTTSSRFSFARWCRLWISPFWQLPYCFSLFNCTYTLTTTESARLSMWLSRFVTLLLSLSWRFWLLRVSWYLLAINCSDYSTPFIVVSWVATMSTCAFIFNRTVSFMLMAARCLAHSHCCSFCG